MGKNSVLNQKINFALATSLIGAAALLGIITMIEVAEEENPIATVIAQTVYAEGE